MAALTKGRKTPRFAGGGLRNLPVAASAVCFTGGLAIAAAGQARAGREGQGADNTAKAADAATYRAVGVFLKDVTGGSADGDVRVDVQEGVFAFKNSAAADEITQVDIGKPCFVVDDQTVAKTSPNSTRAAAGIVQEVGPEGVWVDVSLTNSALLAA
ncbi:hypothetical protein AAG607_13645 [Citromicrobium bathyomarinum]|uniref:hypothetical protein n=1 Tax=Citromicrobium bathyomarinum TaxID=72174 RepID=UPI00315A38EE